MIKANKNILKNIIRALRLPFVTASILPFVFGSLIQRPDFNITGFILGLCAAMSMHLSANLVNDYADSKSGADWQDKNFYKFFGGSKLIQENIFSEKFYLRAGLFCAGISALCVILLAFLLRSPLVAFIFALLIFLSWGYSHKPLRFSYRRLGEFFIFILFGPVPVMGGYFIQTGIFPDFKSFIMSLPFGFFTCGILFANEVPDYAEDIQAGKFTWVSVVGLSRAFVVYYLLIALAFLSIIMNIALGNLSIWAFVCLVFILPAHKAAVILRKYPEDKSRLIISSKITIALQSLIGVLLIIGVLL